MVFLIQNSQNRDGAAMQAKLDELLRAVAKARDAIHRHRASDRRSRSRRSATRSSAETGNEQAGKPARHDESVDRLLKRS